MSQSVSFIFCSLLCLGALCFCQPMIIWFTPPATCVPAPVIPLTCPTSLPVYLNAALLPELVSDQQTQNLYQLRKFSITRLND